jgi:hypothetical protein
MTSDTHFPSPRSTFRLNPWVARCVPLPPPAAQRGANDAATARAYKQPQPFVNRKQAP